MHLTDFLTTSDRSACLVHGLLSASPRGLINELMQILEISVPLQYEGVFLHTTEAQDVLNCRPVLAVDMCALVSDYPFLM